MPIPEDPWLLFYLKKPDDKISTKMQRPITSRHLDRYLNSKKLKANGPDALYLNAAGQFVSGASLGRAPKPSKSIDFQWRTGNLTCYAAQKFTKEVGGNQDNQFNELERLLQDFRSCEVRSVAFFVVVDGPYYTPQRIRQLRQLIRTESPFSYVTGVEGIPRILAEIAAV